MGKSSLEKCAKCGACTVVCPVYRASGLDCYSARGKNHLLEIYKDKEFSTELEDIFAKCLLCGACNKACPRGLDIISRVVDTRSSFSAVYGAHGFEKYLARKALTKPELLHGARFLGGISSKLMMKMLPMDSGLRLRLATFEGDWQSLMPAVKTKSVAKQGNLQSVTYFPGCSASYLYPKIIESSRKIMARYGYSIDIPKGLGCCGLAFESAGDLEAARRSGKKNIEILEKSSGPILVTCGSCWSQLKNYQKLFGDDPELGDRASAVCDRLVEVNQFLAEFVTVDEESDSSARELRIFYHDPCHMRIENDVTLEPRKLLRQIPGAKLLELEDGPQCCGQGGLFHLGAPELSAIIRNDLAHKVVTMKPDVITTSCAGCYMQWKTALAALGSKVKLLYLTELLADKLSDDSES